ncbi:putative FMN-dependent luciferase-like monooxygenase [Serinibacter salmoneus]|uniref:Putative FMN-dependent luciferase-like monooxygenase n=1 Tax=Serinibacter salmoneus TaxID=556530 RepID=A0A2A9D2T1_9MICO|nr:putative FMN-dependent luciferase-like monooxygenase [Serinibacter salmoneus]PFG20160.1 putative FMN-dependent luciferase-like monooxygenase [Serinibacter salmoneus]
MTTDHLRLGVFTRLLDETSPAQRYRNAGDLVVRAEQLGLHSAWVAQHHFHAAEGGLPSPAVLLGWIAAQTSRIRLATGIITLPLEQPLRVAEDLAVLDELSGGRVEPGFGTGGTPSSFLAFGKESADRRAIYAHALAEVLDAWGGGDLGTEENQLYPQAPTLSGRVWEATFSAAGAARIGAAGHGLMLSRSQPRPEGQPDLRIWEIQEEVVDAYLDALPGGVEPRIAASRSVFVADSEDVWRREADRGLRAVARAGGLWGLDPQGSVEELVRRSDTVVGTPERVVEELRRDTVLTHATDLLVQVHSVDPVHDLTLRSLELLATQVAPELGIALAEGASSVPAVGSAASQERALEEVTA